MHLLSLLLALLVLPVGPAGSIGPQAPADGAPVLQNPGFECGDGYDSDPLIHGMVPKGWTAEVLIGNPTLNSTQMWTTLGVCELKETWVEKLEGCDSNIFLASDTRPDQDFDAPPFDVALYQPVMVTVGTEYSLSAWMTSLCGGSSSANPCPAGTYIAKMAGLDPSGGNDPLAQRVEWTEDRRPHTEMRWANLILATTAQTSMLTVFVRVNSPFHHRGNHAFADAVKLVRSPASWFVKVGAQSNDINVAWDGNLGPDIPAIPASNHKLSFEIDMRIGDGEWKAWLRPQSAGEQTLAAWGGCTGQMYQFRIRTWGIQPAGQPGAWPDHHFVGVWHESAKVNIPPALACSNHLYLPLSLR